jgi:endonuclease/exonuclease/phosphatase (EEP) superfamily protein YafD
MMRIFRFFIYLFGIMTFTATVLGYFGNIHPALDSLGHFRIQLAALTVLFGLLTMLIGGMLGGAALLVTGALVLWTTLTPMSGAANAATNVNNGAVYRLLQSNVRFDNRTPDEFIRLVAQTKPDVMTLQEIPLVWQQKLASVKHLYPYQLICPANDRVGPSAIISRRPFTQGSVGQCLKDSNVAVQDIDFGGRVVTIASLHLHWPWPKRQPEELADILPSLTKLKSNLGGVILTGDLNAATWSYAATTIADATATTQLHYAGGSWLPLELPTSWTKYIGLPIDNVFYNGHINLRSAARQSGIGSDHLPILVEFSIPTIDSASYPDQAAS